MFIFHMKSHTKCDGNVDGLFSQIFLCLLQGSTKYCICSSAHKVWALVSDTSHMSVRFYSGVNSWILLSLRRERILLTFLLWLSCLCLENLKFFHLGKSLFGHRSVFKQNNLQH